MTTFKMVDYLIERPAIGVICAASGATTNWLTNLLTDDISIKMISNAGVIMAAFITAITLIGVAIKFGKQVYIEVKLLRKEIKKTHADKHKL